MATITQNWGKPKTEQNRELLWSKSVLFFLKEKAELIFLTCVFFFFTKDKIFPDFRATWGRKQRQIPGSGGPTS